MRRSVVYDPVPFPTEVRGELVATLEQLHADEPFGPMDVRATARRVAGAAATIGLEPMMVRGRVDVGGAELDHVFVVVDDRVVDLALPVRAASFAQTVRAWVAGDLDHGELVARAAQHGIEDRVVGDYPRRLCYRGAPLWGQD